MDIRTAMTQLAAIQLGLSITQPVASGIKAANKFIPSQAGALPDPPAFMNTYTLVSEGRVVSLRKQRYEVRMQLLVFDADQNQAADIASAYLAALITALDGKITLNGTCTTQTLRGGSPTLVEIERAGQKFIGLDLFLDVVMDEGATFGV